jgi:AbrB family looped-hinge helix DNA binding protein
MAEYIVNKDGRITIPAEPRKDMNLRPGDRLAVQAEGDYLILTPLSPEAGGSGTSIEVRFIEAEDDVTPPGTDVPGSAPDVG